MERCLVKNVKSEHSLNEIILLLWGVQFIRDDCTNLLDKLIKGDFHWGSDVSSELDTSGPKGRTKKCSSFSPSAGTPQPHSFIDYRLVPSSFHSSITVLFPFFLNHRLPPSSSFIEAVRSEPSPLKETKTIAGTLPSSSLWPAGATRAVVLTKLPSNCGLEISIWQNPCQFPRYIGLTCCRYSSCNLPFRSPPVFHVLFDISLQEVTVVCAKLDPVTPSYSVVPLAYE